MINDPGPDRRYWDAVTSTADPADTSATARAMAPTRPLTRDGRGNKPISQLPYLPGLDGIRALAVLAVMVYHANSNWLPGGYLGVEVFFVISGYLITLLLIAEHERSGEVDLKQFWIRRFRRLLPALFVMMLLLTVYVALFERDQLGKLRGDVIAGTFYGSNFYQIWIGAGYSAGNDFAPLRHLWSLAVEEQFYLVWPLVMFAFLRVGSRRIAGIARWLFLAAVAITVIVALVSYGGPQQNPEFTPDAYWNIFGRSISKPDGLYLSTFSRAGGLLLGAGFAMIWRPAAVMRGPLRNKPGLFDLVALVGIIVLGVMTWFVAFQPDQGVGFLFQGGLFVTALATLAVIAAVTHSGANTGKILSLPVLVWIGTRSYGLYLYHWPIYQIIRNIAANKLRLHEFVLALVATCIITELSYRYIETPIRQGKLGELWKQRRAGITSRNPLTDVQRKRAFAATAVAALLGVFAIGSMATAELKQNDLALNLEEAKASTCDVLVDFDCDGVDDVDADGNPIAPVADSTATAEDDLTAVSDPAAQDVPVTTAEGDAVETEPTAAPDSTAPGTTAPPATARPGANRLSVGDSVMLGAAPQLGEIGFTVDAIESRAWVNGLDTIEQLGAQGRLPDELVIHLGTNGPIGQTNMDRMMAAVATVPKVVLLTNDVDRDYTAGNNELIFAAAAANDNVSVLDWNGLTTGCTGDCFEADGFHLKPAGKRYYADLIAGALSS
ncbi:acyltransferase family protein [Ilumatobacter sp.]|uniref:acyltransferase family protein n=1 Tax=Ilumatobacter sp. TaxID=1967498 RepID=UPI003C47C75A